MFCLFLRLQSGLFLHRQKQQEAESPSRWLNAPLCGNPAVFRHRATARIVQDPTALRLPLTRGLAFVKRPEKFAALSRFDELLSRNKKRQKQKNRTDGGSILDMDDFEREERRVFSRSCWVFCRKPTMIGSAFTIALAIGAQSSG